MINSKEKKYLKSLAHHFNPIFQIGKEGIGENQIRSLGDALEAHELIKISVLKTCPLELREVSLDLSSALRADIVQNIGRVIVLYRPSKNKIINLKEI